MLVVGAPGEDGSAIGINGNQASNGAQEAGAAYVFTRLGPDWMQVSYVKASNTAANDLFGSAIGVGGSSFACAAVEEDSSAQGINGNQANDAANQSGAVYVFH